MKTKARKLSETPVVVMSTFDPGAREGKFTMINHASECAKSAGRFSFGVDESKTAEALRKLADEIESGKVVLYSVSSSSHAGHAEFTTREVVIEVLEENPKNGPQMIKS